MPSAAKRVDHEALRRRESPDLQASRQPYPRSRELAPARAAVGAHQRAIGRERSRGLARWRLDTRPRCDRARQRYADDADNADDAHCAVEAVRPDHAADAHRAARAGCRDHADDTHRAARDGRRSCSHRHAIVAPTAGTTVLGDSRAPRRGPRAAKALVATVAALAALAAPSFVGNPEHPLVDRVREALAAVRSMMDVASADSAVTGPGVSTPVPSQPSEPDRRTASADQAPTTAEGPAAAETSARERLAAAATPAEEPAAAASTPIQKPAAAPSTPIREPATAVATPVDQPATAGATPVQEPATAAAAAPATARRSKMPTPRHQWWRQRTRQRPSRKRTRSRARRRIGRRRRSARRRRRRRARVRPRGRRRRRARMPTLRGARVRANLRRGTRG